MARKPNTVNWERVNQWVAREGVQANWQVYGAPAIMAVNKTAFSDAEPMPRWAEPEKLILSVAINGAFFRKDENPNQPISSEEIIRSAQECIDAGAQIIHIHARDERGYNVLDTGLFKETLTHLRRQNNHIALDACLVAVNDEEEKMMSEMMSLGVMEGVPVNATSIVLGDNRFVKSPAAMIEKTRRALAQGLTPQIAVYSDADIDNARRYLIDSGLIEGPLNWLVLPGLPGCSPTYSPETMIDGFMRLVRLIRHIDPASVIVACTGGRSSSYLATLAILMGVHVRVGMEDTVWKWPHRDDKIQSNVEVFRQISGIASALGRDLMGADEYRKLMTLAS
ncbi:MULTISPECIES: 3-keto-5-aminohexanoate cleavage protein [unclassified Mesorhizobium]|uniref:3-keto-5-aminohexanoate cleavage protein n=1 Tax=unclassified Mesorhizobium TaxID=325217 RepID=UPI000BB005E6|nr:MULTISPECIES: 3-keto-5-aminohexanoate cleavage protein [unclassified Mesorhizobium]AZO07836.1 3-keto-5-aminohexanoate cleavage protein [Mesorhizobium sp. M3A.F.Ca.ET.080.04.2.1]PBB86833.1 3-keto-5-aminohexanoate cleavage protein [Mesorhizobium sp. WSM3876]RWF21256.1 MAG: 3-keto-5-aminohexanoate cleavage protein [Mesorhizobium sp.]